MHERKEREREEGGTLSFIRSDRSVITHACVSRDIGLYVYYSRSLYFAMVYTRGSAHLHAHTRQSGIQLILIKMARAKYADNYVAAESHTPCVLLLVVRYGISAPLFFSIYRLLQIMASRMQSSFDYTII